MKGGDLDKFNKIFFMMFMMEIFGKILMVENIIFFIEEGNYGLMLNVDWF